MNLRALSEFLPTGESISSADFAKRHRLIWLILAAHLPVVVIVGLVNHVSALHVAVETGPLFLLTWLVSRPLSRAALANVTSFTLLAVSAELIHFTHGMPEMHMHLLVMLVLVALYEDVRAYFIAVGFVVVHHIGLSLIAGNSVFAQSSARDAPVLWSLLHAGLVVLETSIIMVFWKAGHDAKQRLEQALSAQTNEIDGRRQAEIERTEQAAELEQRLRAEVEMKVRLEQRTAELARQAGAVGAGMEDINTAVSRLSSAAHGIGRSVVEVTSVTDAATQETRATSAVIAELRESRTRIEEILQVIQSIAGKTNLLALNATIEAARAGSVGRGFAVVAGEVKTLAGQTARAVADIADTLEGIGNGTEAAVGAMDRITSVVDRIGSLQRSIAEAVEEQQQSSDDISRTIATASADVARVLGGVQELAQV